MLFVAFYFDPFTIQYRRQIWKCECLVLSENVLTRKYGIRLYGNPYQRPLGKFIEKKSELKREEKGQGA